jgi:hypothetical protein
MDKLLTEDMFHRGETNGLLRVSHRQFISHGVGSMQRIQDALKELVGAGLLSKTKAPRCGKFEGPNLYRITFKGTLGGPATWRPSNVEPLPKKQRKESWKSTLLEEFKREAV